MLKTMNNVQLYGKINDLIEKTTKAGYGILELKLQTDFYRWLKQGDSFQHFICESQIVPITFYGEKADDAKIMCQKGNIVIIEGKIKINSYTAKNNITYENIQIVGQNIVRITSENNELMDTPESKTDNTSKSEVNVFKDDYIPF